MRLRTWAAAPLAAASIALATPSVALAAVAAPTPAHHAATVTSIRHTDDGDWGGNGRGRGGEEEGRFGGDEHHRRIEGRWHRGRRHCHCRRRTVFIRGERRRVGPGPRRRRRNLRAELINCRHHPRALIFSSRSGRLLARLDKRIRFARVDGLRFRLRDRDHGRPRLEVSRRRGRDHREFRFRRVHCHRHYRFHRKHFHRRHFRYPYGPVAAGAGGSVQGMNNSEMAAGGVLMAAAAGGVAWARRRRSAA